MSNLAWIVLTYSWSVLWLCCYVKVESRYVICHLYVSWVWYVIWPSWWASGQSILYALRLFWCVMHTLDNIIMAILVCFSIVLIIMSYGILLCSMAVLVCPYTALICRMATLVCSVANMVCRDTVKIYHGHSGISWYSLACPMSILLCPSSYML